MHPRRKQACCSVASDSGGHKRECLMPPTPGWAGARVTVKTHEAQQGTFGFT